MRVGRKRFEELVRRGVEAIPARFLAKMRNVAIVVEYEPTRDQLAENGVPEDETLLGLFEGIPAGYQGASPWELPCKITIFQGPTEEEAETEDEIAEIVKDTVWHEIAHYWGMDEHEVRSAEERRTKKPPQH